jgi:hypothetical protein
VTLANAPLSGRDAKDIILICRNREALYFLKIRKYNLTGICDLPGRGKSGRSHHGRCASTEVTFTPGGYEPQTEPGTMSERADWKFLQGSILGEACLAGKEASNE